MSITAIPPISGFGTTVTMAGMAFASVDAKESQDGVSLAQSAARLFYGWMIASGGLVWSSVLSFLLLRRILARLHGQWDMLSTIKSDRRFRALQGAVRERGLWMAVLSRFCPIPYCCTCRD